MSTTHTQRWLTAIVAIHLVISFVHGAAHAGAQVPLSLAGNLFVWLVILAGPILGVILQRFVGAAGTWLIAGTLAASLVFGVVNHFVFETADHIHHVTGPWSMTFAMTAGLLALTEAAGAVLGFQTAIRGRRVS